MKKMYNSEVIEGRVFSHELKLSQVKNEKSDDFGKDFISGNLNIAVDEEGLNVITVHYTYVKPLTNSGKENRNFKILKQIIDGAPMWSTHGKDAALMVKAEPALALSDFYDREGKLVSVKRNEGGFISTVTELGPEEERNTFKVDILITKTERIEKDEEKKINEDYVAIKGAIFDFRNAILPIDIKIKNPAGMDYFENLGASPKEPVLTKLWGRIVSETKVETKTEESAFGEAAVQTTTRKIKEYIVTGSQKIPYDFGDEAILTEEEVKTALANREVYLAETKKSAEEYAAKKAASASAATTNTAAVSASAGGFNF